MATIIGVRFKRIGKIYYFDPNGLDIKKNDYVIVETTRGIEYTQVVFGNREESNEKITSQLKKVIRLATDDDHIQQAKNKDFEKEAMATCAERIEKHGLDMKLIDIELTFDRTKVIFYFTADGRVDFRELVKDLANTFHMRIELRQIGVRDEVKLLNGIGICGRTLCCATFLPEFQPVSIKMAKEQGLSLSPTKISGICGRLMCCLKYEEDTYEYYNRNMPAVGDTVNTPEGRGDVMEVNILKQTVRVAVRKKPTDTATISVFNASECKLVSKGKSKDEAAEQKMDDLAD
jgi:cell fate regulator YaaT (PSP1 superfamily)